MINKKNKNTPGATISRKKITQCSCLAKILLLLITFKFLPLKPNGLYSTSPEKLQLVPV